MGDIRDNLKTVIIEKGFIQNVIAKKSNLSPAKLSSILSKNRRLEANEMFAICVAIEMTPEELKNYNHATERV